MKNYFKVLLYFYFLAFNANLHVNNISANDISLNREKHFPGISYWRSFVRYDFVFEGGACRLTCPSEPAEGDPWIRNARFPVRHTEI